MTGTLRLQDKNVDVHFRNLQTDYRGHTFRFDIHIPFGQKILVRSQEPSGSKVFIDLLKGYNTTHYDKILINGLPLPDYNLHALRENILVVDNITIVEGTIRELFQILSPEVQTDDILNLLDIVGLGNILSNLPDGIDTALSPTGYPLLPEEIVSLKLAVVMAAKPAVMVVTEVLDTLPVGKRNAVLKHLCQTPDMTLICFSNKKQHNIFGHYYYVGPNPTRHFATLELLGLHEDEINQEV
jgi:ABC-type multidrug transport system fused ATPase/permease subunit